MRISDWSSDVCSSDLRQTALADQRIQECGGQRVRSQVSWLRPVGGRGWRGTTRGVAEGTGGVQAAGQATDPAQRRAQHGGGDRTAAQLSAGLERVLWAGKRPVSGADWTSGYAAACGDRKSTRLKSSH